MSRLINSSLSVPSPFCLCQFCFFLYLRFPNHLLSHHRLICLHLRFLVFRLCLLSFCPFDRISWLVIVISISICFPPSLVFSSIPHRNIRPRRLPIQLLSSTRPAPHSIPSCNLKTLYVVLAQSTPASGLRYSRQHLYGTRSSTEHCYFGPRPTIIS